MVKDYLYAVSKRAGRDACKVVIAESWADTGKKLFGAAVLLGVLYLGTSLGLETTAFSDQVKSILAGLTAIVVGVALVFLFNLLVVAPYQLWSEEKERAKRAEEALVGTEAARIVQDCTKDGVVDYERLRAEMDRITDPDREFHEAWTEAAERQKLEAKAKARSAFEMRRLTGELGDPVALGANLLEQDTRNGRRRLLLERARAAALEYRPERSTIHIGEADKGTNFPNFHLFIEKQPAFVEIRRFLSSEYLGRLEGGNDPNKPPIVEIYSRSGGIPGPARAFLDELDRLQTKWGLDDS